ncbi:MAG: hypothetical protein A2W98_01190 [Bacteroidetes bacterium GWF2_33_38]|nr:MAG: hypothetical protein A2W98_01190 [Bacteroidetes bacterium GWF2_33_38]OFY73578.1 MAG: hypothetical protein A2265_02450 [Bacteroidetes bacterium RIFOXYA12_FULL_33_9]OFY91553.1 MAG: hypothetical protein A2236_10585 [Bacteroidetes bacterium RIFOXYA2_FULL_33_7]HBX50591.1 hypothetical protein [Bacteroidales bacterium]
MEKTNTQVEWDFYQSHYRDNYSSKSGWNDPSLFFVKDLIRLNHINTNSLLEIGYGDGKTLQSFSKIFKQVSGADISPKNIEITEKEFGNLKITNADFFVFDLMESVSDNRLFDNVLLSHVIEHFTQEELKIVIPNLLKKIKPGGKLIGAVPYKLPFNFRYCPHCQSKFELDGHQIIYDENIIRETFKQYELKEILVRNYNFSFYSRNDNLIKKQIRKLYHLYRSLRGDKPKGQLEFCFEVGK